MSLAPTVHKPVISSVAREATAHMDNSVGGTSAVWPGTNSAYLVPFAMRSPYLVRRVWWANGSGTITGNVDVGIYTLSGTLLVSSGATAQANASVIQSVALGTPFLLGPGSYYMAMSSSSATATFFHFAPSTISLQQLGVAQAGTANPLPATVTFATITSNHLPLFGIASAGVI